MRYTHNKQEFECAPSQRDIFWVVLNQDVEDVAIVNEYLGYFS